MEHQTIEKAVSFFTPFLEQETRITFFGGEPLLAFDTIRYTVDLLETRNEKEESASPQKFIYSLTTNGSLVTQEIVDYFNRYRFEVMLSFDGLIQDKTRQKGTHDHLKSVIHKIKSKPDIDFSINSVFTPQTVSSLAESLQYVLDMGVNEVLLSLSPFDNWDEIALEKLEKQLDELSQYLLKYYKEKGIIPIPIFRERYVSEGGCFLCAGGVARIAITPDSQVWGCYLFHDFLKSKSDSSDFQTYSLGTLDEFIKNHETIFPRILENYRDLRQDRFFTEETFCFLCENVNYCHTCPINGAYSTGMIGKIPTWICNLNRTQRRVVEKFQKQLEKFPKNV